MRVETKTEIQTREIQLNTYIANDGTEFDDAKKCEMYEANLAIQELKHKLELIQTCKDIEGCSPVDGGEYYENHDFRWYLPKTQDEADIIVKYYNLEYGISSDEIGEWICVEAYDIDDPTDGCYSMPIKESVLYVEKLFGVLGYNVSITKSSSDEMALESAVDCNFEYNYIFTLGYDLLQNFLSEKPCECDAAFEFCKIIYTYFKQSEYINPNKSEYDCLKEYVNSLTYDQLDELYWTDWSTL